MKIINLGNGKSIPISKILKICEKKIRGNNNLTNNLKKNTNKIVHSNFWADNKKINAISNNINKTSIESGILKIINSSNYD